MTKETSIFNLIGIGYCDNNPQYPSFEVRKDTVGCFSSLAKAEQTMKEVADRACKKFFGFLINEHVVDKPAFCSAKSRRSYLPDGSFLDETIASEVYDAAQSLETFHGRPADKIRFSAGDLVEVMDGDKVSLETVYQVPPTIEEVKSRIRFASDYTDDCYTTIPVECSFGHKYPEGVFVFPLRFPVSNMLREKLRKMYLNYATEKDDVAIVEMSKKCNFLGVFTYTVETI